MTVGFVGVVPSEAQAPRRTFLQYAPKEYAHHVVMKKWDSKNQYVCLLKLWGKESAWNPKAYNKISVGGLHAGGIPQILGLNPKLHHTIQINRGIKYIVHRYDTPCNAWGFWLKQSKKGYGWY